GLVVTLADGTGVFTRALVIAHGLRYDPPLLAAALGCEVTPAGTIETDGDGRTGVSGVFAAGDAATEHYRSVANAIGSGSRTGYAVTVETAGELASREPVPARAA